MCTVYHVSAVSECAQYISAVSECAQYISAVSECLHRDNLDEPAHAPAGENRTTCLAGWF